MTTIETMYAPQVNSPATTLSANISSSATSISVLSGATLPAAPNLLVIGGDTENAETVRMTAKSGNTITVVRGVEGTARAWNTGALIARLFTAKDLADVQTNITNLDSGKAEASDLAAAEQRIDDVYASTASGSIATFERITGGMPVNSLEVAITPKQAGTGDPSPTNVRAISGWTGANVYADGINIWDEEWEVGGIRTTDGSDSSTSGYYRSKNYIPVLPETTYYMVLPVGMNTMFYDASKTYLSYGYVSSNNTFTTPAGARYMRFRNATANAWTPYGNDISINYPSTDHNYHSYAGTTKSISFGQTVYGGTLNVTTGVLTVNKAIIDLGSLSYTKYSVTQGTMFRSDEISGADFAFNSTAFVCSNYATAKSASRAEYTISAGQANKVDIIDSNYSDATTFKSAMSGVKLVYPIATPTTIQLTPEQVSTLQGTNNIWADTGDVIEVTFGEDIKAYVDAKAADKQDKITVSGILKGDGTGGVSAAVAGTDYQAPLTAGTDYQTPLDEKALQWYGVCSTAASTQAKTVSITGITALTEGLEIRVKMTNAQTYNGTPTLNVNSLGAKTIKQHGSTDAVRYQWQAGEVISFTYDGTYWVIENNSLATTTYFGLTRLNSATNSTAEDCAATPKAVKTAYDLADAAIPATEKGTNVATLATAADSTTPSVPRITPAQSFAPIFDITADTTLAAKHAGGILKCTNSPTITIPSNVFAEATQIEILNYGTGVVTIAGASGCSVNGTSAGSETLADQYKSAVLLAISASQWVIQGAIE